MIDEIDAILDGVQFCDNTWQDADRERRDLRAALLDLLTPKVEEFSNYRKTNFLDLEEAWKVADTFGLRPSRIKIKDETRYFKVDGGIIVQNGDSIYERQTGPVPPRRTLYKYATYWTNDKSFSTLDEVRKRHNGYEAFLVDYKGLEYQYRIGKRGQLESQVLIKPQQGSIIV